MTSLQRALADGAVVLDGGLGTLLESRGHDLGSSLWSARMLVEHPDELRSAHREFFDAGARVAISGSYQVSYEGFARLGHDRAATDALLASSVQLARAARDDAAAAGADGVERWVAASVGPYGAMLADGSEYRGDYGLGVDELRSWHRPRLNVLGASGADVLAVETIPCLAEVEAIALELRGTGVHAWVAVTAAMGRLRSGEALEDAYAILDGVDEIIAVGINCSDPLDVGTAIRAARSVTGKPFVAYPNSGEQWDAKNRRWMGAAAFPADLVRDWRAAGASLIGGCCRVGPAEIAAISAALG
ncbi:MAG: homocysteine S-methyltransferase [Actinomycetota bacterium]|nr:homocysteine S-methyltransferase [Actinomycetota bacterium]